MFTGCVAVYVMKVFQLKSYPSYCTNSSEFQSVLCYQIFMELIGTVSAKIALRLKCYKNASRLNRYNFPTDNAIDFLFSTLHYEMV